MGNGADCLAIGFAGSMCGSRGHLEEHQGLVAGWYKQAHRVYYIPEKLQRASLRDENRSPGIETGTTCPILQAGYTISVDGEPAGVSDYRQSFDARNATVTTAVTLRDVKLTVTSFLTDEHLWMETISLLTAPENKTIDLALFLNPFSDPHMMSLTLRRQSTIQTRPQAGSGSLAFDYNITPNAVRGGGYMWATPKGRAQKNEIKYTRIKPGFTVTRYLLAMDNTESSDWQSVVRAEYERMRKSGAEALRKAHNKTWNNYSRRSSINVPDRATRGLYDFSMYWMRANQYPENGSMNLGPFPYHWGGGCNAIPDAWSMQIALLTGNHIEESRRLLDFYEQRMPRARFVAKALNSSGARLCYFASAEGQDYHENPEKIRTEKIGANAMACYSFYDHWLASGNDDFLIEALGIMRELLDHILETSIIEKSDRAYIGVSKPSYEGKGDVSNDSMISVWVTRALRGYCEMAAAAKQPVPIKYRRIADKLPGGLRENYRDGFMMPFRNAKFHNGAIQCFFFNLPDGIDRKSVLRDIKANRSRFGFDGDTYIGNIRNWPWSYCWQSIVYSHWGWDKKSFDCLQKAMSNCSSMGAMPEKIRIDGYPVNYYYTSTHAYYLWAVQTALCHDRPKNILGLLQGMDGTWENLKFRQLRMRGGLLVSLEVRNSRAQNLILHNHGTRPVTRTLLVNPRYNSDFPRKIEIQPGQTLEL